MFKLTQYRAKATAYGDLADTSSRGGRQIKPANPPAANVIYFLRSPSGKAENRPDVESGLLD